MPSDNYPEAKHLGVDETMLLTSKLGLNHTEIHWGFPSSADE